MHEHVGLLHPSRHYSVSCTALCRPVPQLPASFVPVPADGEVEEFKLMGAHDVAAIVAGSTEFKTNCCLVIIDFFMRHGLITPEQPGYLALTRMLRQGDLC